MVSAIRSAIIAINFRNQCHRWAKIIPIPKKVNILNKKLVTIEREFHRRLYIRTQELVVRSMRVDDTNTKTRVTNIEIFQNQSISGKGKRGYPP